MSRTLLFQLRSEFRRVADPKSAPVMQQYMKSSMPYHGVPAVPMRQVCQNCFRDFEFRNEETWRKAVLYIFRNARFREEWYAAVELCRSKKARDIQSLDALPVYEEMIVTSAWWDVVDSLAPHGVGLLLRNFPKPIAREMRSWSHSENMWKRRSAIISQLTFKNHVWFIFETLCAVIDRAYSGTANPGKPSDPSSARNWGAAPTVGQEITGN
jgi:3-methyladenine DNA glycosylase AlkD